MRVAVVLTVLFCSRALAVQPPQREALHDFDRRQQAAMPEAAGRQLQREQAAANLKVRVPGVRVDEAQGRTAPKFIGSTRGFLTGPRGEGGAAPAGVAPGIAQDDEHRAVKTFLEGNRALFGHGAEALTGARTRRDYTHGELRTTVWNQELDGIEVFEAVMQAHTTTRGELVNVSSQFVPDLGKAAAKGAPGRGARLAAPAIGAAQAVALAAQNVGEEIAAAQVFASDAAAGPERKQRFRAPRVLDVSALYVWLPVDDETLRLCWQVQLVSKSRGEMFKVLIDAETGEALLRHGLTNYISNASYRVYTSDSPSPFSPGHATPLSTQPATVARTLVTTPALDTTASPNGWINDGVNETVGNNVDAHTDTNADDVADLPRPQGSPSRVFDFAMDLTQAPSTYRNAAVTNLFYWCNLIHDRFYQLGFTEAAGNFQTNNFGRGGLGNDAVLADAQDGSGTNNANFSTPADGSPGRMQMFVFDAPTPDIDGDFDHEIVIHEYAHGLSNRLVGGGVGISALQPRGMGEGWSDFYGLALLSQAGDAPAGNYAAGGYATYLLGGMTTNYYYGIRRYPYSTDLTKNPLTFRDIDTVQANAHTGIPRSPIIGTTPNEVHNMGEVWCVALWEVRANLIAKHGYAIGNELCLQLVTDGMKLAPANPNFLQARDGIIQADLVRTSGANRGELWAGFAKRGMGAGATSPVSSTTAGLVESYDLPDDLGVSPAGGFNSRGEVGGPFDVTSTQFTLRNNGAASLNWTAGANVPWLSLSSASGTLAAGATVNVSGSLNAAANSLANGLHTATATFTNTTSGIVQTRVFTLRVGVVDYFTEAFDTSANDTENQSFLFTPNGSQSFYRASRTVVAAFPTDPAGGTALPLGDDTFNTVALTGGATVKLYGASYGTLYVGSNGYVTFGAGDSSLSSATSEHFAYKRIAALMMDLYPSTTAVTWRQLADRVAVTWQNVPVYGTSNSNSLQIEMFFDGRVRITILGIDATGGLIGLSNGAGVPVDFAESDFSSYGSDALLTLTLPVQTVEGAGTLANAGRVSTSYAPSSALVVTLTSNRPDKLAVPATVTIPAGQTSVLFSPVAGDNALLDGTQRATVTATAAEFVTGSASVGVDDNETTALYLLAPGSAVEGDPDLQGIVLLNVAAESDVTVTLISGNPAEAVMPASVLIPAGQNSANFPITVIDDARIDGTVTLGLTAHVANWTDGFATLAIADNEATTLAVTLPGAIREGDGPRSGTVQIPGTLTSALTVALASSDTSELTLPATVTIPAGQTSAAFTATVVDDAEADGAQNATLTVSAAGFTSGTRTVSVADNDAHHFTLSTVGSPQIPNVPFALTVTARDVNDTTITNYNSPVNLTAAGSSGAVPMTPATLTGWTGGVRSGNVAATAFDSGVVLTVDDGQGHSGTSNAFDVVLGPLDHFTFNAVASPQMLDTPFSVDISAVDIGGNRIASFSDAAALSIELSSGASIPIDPASTGGFTGGSWTGQVSSPVAVTNLRLVARNGATLIGKSNAFTVQAPPLPPGTSGSVFTEPFETATLGPWWTVTGTATYRTQVTTANVPHGGLRHLTMDSSSDGTYARNEATLTVNLAGRTGVTMTFWAKSFSDEPNGPPTSPFVGGADFDGVAISADGTNWYEVQALRTLTSTYAQFTVNLDAAIAARGLSYGSSFKIRFNQYDNFAIATDGIGIDDIAITAAVVPTTTLTVPAQAAEGAGPLAGTVTLASTAIADTTVALTSLSPAKVTVPASVLVPAGQSTAGFTFTVLDNTLLDGNRSVTLLADTTGSTSILVVDNETAALSIAVPPSATEGAAALTGTVTLGAVPSGTIVLSLSSSDTTEATVPATVAFAAGQTSATFPITIVNDTLIDGTQTATISVGAAGWTAASGTISVADNESTALTLTAPGVAEGANGTGSVSIAGTMPAPLVVTLTNPSPSELITPATVTIAAGLSSVSFTYTGVDNALKDGTRSITVTASAAGFTSANRTILVADNEVDHFTFGTIASPQIANRTFSTTLEARDVNDVTMTAFTGTVNLTASGVGGAVPVTPASVTLFSGAWSGTLAIAAPRAGVTITASAAGATGASGVFDVGLGALDRFTWSAIASPQVVGAPFTATVTAQDFYSNTVTDFTGTAALSAGTPARLTGTGASNDAYLFSTSDQQRNQAIYLPSEIGPAGQIAVIAINPNVTSGTGGALTNFTVRMKHTSLTSYVTAAWESTGWTTVYQGNLAVTGTGSFWVNIPLTVPFAYNGTSQLMVDISHNGISTVSANALSSVTSASRMLNFAGSGFADPLTWTGTTSPVPIASAGLPNLRIYLANTLLVTPATTAAFTNGVWTGPIAVNQAATGVALRAASGAILGESNAFTVAGAATMQVTPATGLTSAGTRGGPFTPASTAFTITNTGTIALSWTAAKTASWVTLSTASGSLAAGASASVTASINSNANSLATGAYADTVTFTNVTNGTGNTTRAVSLTANPVGDLTVTPGTNFTATGPFGGPVAPGSKSYTLTNTGDAALNWTASKTSAWLSLSANAGTLAAGASTTVTATIAAAALEPGSYSDILILTNTSTGRGSTTRGVTLGISLPAPTLLPEPPVTGGTGNTVSWSSVFGADLYEVQIATDAAFTTPLSSGWIAGTSHTFTGLADGTAYRYRVRASRTVESAWSGTVSSVQDATSPALTFSSAVATLTASHSVVGMAGDANGIQSVTVNGVSAATADAFLHWTSGATLAPGWNLFTVAASDSAVPANVTTAAHSVYLATATSDADGDGLPDAWELAHGLDLFDATGGSGASADPERDGIPHLLELAFGLDPLVADVSGLPVAAGEIDPADGQTYLTLRYRRLLAPGALIYGIEVSSDLATWSSTAADFEELAPAVATGDGLTETVTIRVKPALTAPGNPARQVRVRVTAP